MTKMPPLPEPVGEVDCWDDVPAFNTDQMRALQLATWNAALEAAAKACEEVERTYVDDSNKDTAAPLIRECASAIRSMKEPQ